MCVYELVGHPHVPAGLVDEREVEGNLPPQIPMIIRETLKKKVVEYRSIYCSLNKSKTKHVCVPLVSEPAGREPPCSNVWPSA